MDTTGPAGLILGAVGVAAVAVTGAAAHWLAWNRSRAVQLVAKRTVGALSTRWLDTMKPKAEYARSDISQHFWPNGKLPTSEEWQGLAADDFRLRVYGLVENPVELSLDEIIAMSKQEQTTMQHCI